MWRRLETCFRKVSCCFLQVNRINIGLLPSVAILCCCMCCHVSPSGLTSTVIVEVVDNPCLVGTDVTLRCQPDGVPRSRVTWFYNVQQISSNSKYHISDYPDFTLTITNVVSSDAGSYTCRAVNTLTNGTVSGAVSGMFSKACGEFAVNAYSFTCTHRHTHTHSHTHGANILLIKTKVQK